ncbi:MAG: hypothetical protein KDD11_00785 [Acidobacteria bacterium]|nr:hypothetical protein [Acidobacteriota bacterium]
MNAPLQILRKDVQHLWLPALLWNLWATLSALNLLYAVGHPPSWHYSRVPPELISLFYPGFNGHWLTFVTMAVVLGALLRDAPCWDPAAGWLTRPISGPGLIGSKVAFVSLVLLLPPVLLHLGAFMTLGMPAHDVLAATVWFGLQLVAWSLLVVVTMTLAPQPASHLFVLFVALPLYGRALETLFLKDRLQNLKPALLLDIFNVAPLIPWSLSLSAVGVLVFVGSRRMPWRPGTRWVAGLLLATLPAIVLVLALESLWSLVKPAADLQLKVLAREPTSKPRLDALGALGVQLNFDFDLEPTTESPPATYWFVQSMEVTMSDSAGGSAWRPRVLPKIVFNDQQAVLEALGGATPKASLKRLSEYDRPFNEGPATSTNIYVDPDTFLSRAAKDTQLMGTALLRRQHLKVLGRFPLKGRHQLRSESGWFLALNSTGWGERPWAPDPTPPANAELASRRLIPMPSIRGCEIVAVAYDRAENAVLAAWWLRRGHQLPALMAPPAFTADLDGLEIKGSWLTRGAELVVLEDCLEAIVRTPFVLDHFRMENYTTAAPDRDRQDAGPDSGESVGAR